MGSVPCVSTNLAHEEQVEWEVRRLETILPKTCVEFIYVNSEHICGNHEFFHNLFAKLGRKPKNACVWD